MSVPLLPDWQALAGIHAADPRASARIGRWLGRWPGRWRWAIERLLGWWLAELGAMMPGFAARAADLGVTLTMPDDDILEIATTLPADAIGLAAARAAVKIEGETPFAADAVVAGYRLDQGDGQVRLTVRLVPLTRLHGLRCDGIDALMLGTRPVMAVPVRMSPSSAYLSRRRRRRVVMAAIAAAVAVALLVPIVVRQSTLEREEVRLEEARAILQADLRRAATARRARDAAAAARERQRRAPSAVAVLDRLSRLIDDDTYLMRLRLDGRNVVIGGVSGSASSLPGVLERDPLFARVHLAAPVSRAPDGRQRFEIAMTVAAQRPGR